jgi:hypothetical protein
MSPPTERVFTMTDYYDGPRCGIADYRGRAHLYRSLWADSTVGDLDVFELIPIDSQTLDLALEDWAIRLRWVAAFHRGETSLDMHPALPDDKPRHERLTALLKPLLAIRSHQAIMATAEFVWPSSGCPGVDAPVGVRWTVTDRPLDYITPEDGVD